MTLLSTQDGASAAARNIYLSRFVSQFTNRLLQFCIPMMFITLWNNTFLPTALLSFTTYATHFLILPYCGAMMDAAHRRTAATMLISIKSLCNAAALLSLYAVSFCWEMEYEPQSDFSKGHVGFVLCCVLCIVGETAEESWTLSLERNWVVLLAHDDDKAMTELNVAIRRIDLGCLTVAPLSFGLLLQVLETPKAQVEAGTLLMSILFLVSWVPEMRCVQAAYDVCSLLQHDADDGAHKSAKSLIQSKSNVVKVLMDSWSKYVHHRVFFASLAYSMIYFTVLDGGSVMLSFLKWSGVSETVIGLSRGVGAVMGLLGSALFVPVKDCFGGSLEKTGVVSMWGFWCTLLPAGAAAVYASESSVFGYVVLVCVALARVWLWLFDLDHTLIMQQYLEDGVRAELNGAQSALYRVFWVLLAVVCLFMSEPRDFKYLVFLSLFVVCTASLVFTVWAARLSPHAAPSSDVCGTAPSNVAEVIERNAIGTGSALGSCCLSEDPRQTEDCELELEGN